MKQMLMIHNNAYKTEDERVPYVPDIRKSINRQMKSLMGKLRAKISKYTKSTEKKVKKLSECPFLQLSNDRGTEIVEHKSDVEKVWHGVETEAELQVQQYQIADNLEYFVGKRFEDVCDEKYIPTKGDVLRTRKPTTNIEVNKVCYKDGFFNKKRFVFYDLGGQVQHRDQWTQMLLEKDEEYGSCRYVIFFASLAEFNETLEENPEINRLRESIALFHGIGTG